MSRKNMFNINASKDDSTYECYEFLIRKLDEKMTAEKKKIDGELNRHISKMLNVGVKAPKLYLHALLCV